MHPRLIVLCLALAAGCDDGKPDTAPGDTASSTDTAAPTGTDGDGDGYDAAVDCDDADPDVHPGADESCDGVDNNCDGSIDEGLQVTWHADLDGDGYGDPDEGISSCTQPAGAVEDGSDCDDTRADVNPGAAEVCDDANTDEDCDGLADNDDDSATGTRAWYADRDRDGYGDPGDAIEACDAEPGYISNDGDCDDTIEGAACLSGTWTGDVELDLTIASMGITDTCTGTVSLPIDLSAEPMIDGTGSCASSVVGTISLNITGSIDADGNIEGRADALSLFGVDWDGTITSTELSGSGSGTDTSLGVSVAYVLTIYATP